MTYLYQSLLFFLLFTGLAVAQECDYYADSMKSGNSIFLGTIEKNEDSPDYADVIVTKIDAAGAEVWHTDIPMTLPVRRLNLHDDAGDFLYLEVIYYTGIKIYKINKDTGAIVGQSQHFQFSVSSSYTSRIIVSSEKLVLVIPNSQDFITLPGFVVYTVDKADVSLASIIHTGTESLRGNVLQDSSGNIYYAYQYTFNNYTEPRIRKINGINFKATMWEKGYNTLNDPNLNVLSHILIDNQDNLYLLNGDDYIDIFKVDSTNGSVLWTATGVNDSPSGGDNLSDHLFYNGFLYMSFHHKYYGSGIQSSFLVKKLNVNTGAQSWPSNTLLMTASPITDTTQSQGATSIDLGCDGSIYATGHSDGSQNAAEVWCMMKIDGNTGGKLAEIVLDTDATENNNSHGFAVYNIDDQLVSVGHMEDGFNPVRALATPDINLLTPGVILPNCLSLSTNDIPMAQLEIYPNPTSGALIVMVPEQQVISSIALYDVSGREIAFWKGNQQQLSIDSFPSGIYILKVLLQDGLVAYRKVIKN